MIVECPLCKGKGMLPTGFLGRRLTTCPRCHGSGAVEKLSPYHENEY